MDSQPSRSINEENAALSRRPADRSCALIDRISAGDAVALTDWFHQNSEAVYAFVYFRVGNDSELAAEVTQCTFLSALERLSDYEPGRGDMATWLKFLSRNLIRKQLTEKFRGSQLQSVWDGIDHSLRDAYERIDVQPLPDEVALSEETRELVAMTLSNMPDNYRELLQAKYMNNDSLETIAKSRNTTIDAVKSMLRRSRAAFRECFLALAKVELNDV